MCVCEHIHSYACTEKFGEDLVLSSTRTHTHKYNTLSLSHTHTHTHTHTTGLWDVGKTEPIKVGKASPTEGTLPSSIYFILKYQGMYLYMYICQININRYLFVHVYGCLQRTLSHVYGCLQRTLSRALLISFSSTRIHIYMCI